MVSYFITWLMNWAMKVSEFIKNVQPTRKNRLKKVSENNFLVFFTLCSLVWKYYTRLTDVLDWSGTPMGQEVYGFQVQLDYFFHKPQPSKRGDIEHEGHQQHTDILSNTCWFLDFISPSIVKGPWKCFKQLNKAVFYQMILTRSCKINTRYLSLTYSVC